MPTSDPAKQREYQRRYAQRRRDRVRQSKREYRARLRQWVAAYKVERGCQRCPERHPACLELHHPDPAIKEFEPADMVMNVGLAKIRAEADRCVVLCANCHRKLHAEERTLAPTATGE